MEVCEWHRLFDVIIIIINNDNNSNNNNIDSNNGSSSSKNKYLGTKCTDVTCPTILPNCVTKCTQTTLFQIVYIYINTIYNHNL